MGDRTLDKQRIAAAFGHAAQRYETQAHLQKQCAQILLALLAQHRQRVPPGAILELGCGTGFITQGLVQGWSDRPIEITDLSLEMLNRCRAQIEESLQGEEPGGEGRWANLSFYGMDGEQLQPQRASYAVAIAAFVIQWFQHPAASLKAVLDRLEPGGLLLLSFPSDESFPEWKALCQSLNLPYTANPLPNTRQLLDGLTQHSHLLSLQVQDFTLTYDSAMAVFRSLKAIGAGSTTTGKQLSAAQMRQLMQRWNQCETIQLSQQIVFLALQVP